MEHLSHYSATCKENGESCWQVDDAQLDHNHGQGNATIIEAEICLCGQDRCNNADPVPEVPTTTAEIPTTTRGPNGPGCLGVPLKFSLSSDTFPESRLMCEEE